MLKINLMTLSNINRMNMFFGGIAVAPVRMAEALRNLGHDVEVNGKLKTGSMMSSMYTIHSISQQPRREKEIQW